MVTCVAVGGQWAVCDAARALFHWSLQRVQ